MADIQTMCEKIKLVTLAMVASTISGIQPCWGDVSITKLQGPLLKCVFSMEAASRSWPGDKETSRPKFVFTPSSKANEFWVHTESGSVLLVIPQGHGFITMNDGWKAYIDTEVDDGGQPLVSVSRYPNYRSEKYIDENSAFKKLSPGFNKDAQVGLREELKDLIGFFLKDASEDACTVKNRSFEKQRDDRWNVYRISKYENISKSCQDLAGLDPNPELKNLIDTANKLKAAHLALKDGHPPLIDCNSKTAPLTNPASTAY